MYPFRRRYRWFLASRYAHLVRALDNRRRPIQDSTLEARIEAMRFWSRLHVVVLILLSLGVAAALATWFTRYLPTFDPIAEGIADVAWAASVSSGFLSLAYLFLTRLLGQIEADILAILTVDHAGKS